MGRQKVAPTLDEHGHEIHPAWVVVGAYRGSVSPPGAVLFDSDIRHQHVITVQVSEAHRKRDLNRDWIGGGKRIIEFTMSEAQWASFVSSMNSGTGVPATLGFRDSADDPHVPGMPFDPRLAHSMDEVRNATTKAQEDVRRAFDAYSERKTVGNLRHLEAMIDNLPANLAFAAESLSEHAENVVQRAKADIEAFVINKAEQLGIERSEIGTLQLGAGEDEV
jgi:hypothetical protein